MRDYLKKNKISVSELSKRTGIPYSTLNDIVNGKTEINNIKFQYVKSIAEALNLSLDEFDRMFSGKTIVQVDLGIKVVVKNKCYYLVCELCDSPEYICKVNELNSYYVQTMAEWKYAELKRREAMKNWKTKLSST